MLRTPEFEGAIESLRTRLEAQHDCEQAKGDDPEVLLELIVTGKPEAARDMLGDLRRWLAGATKVVLCDPYLLHFRPSAMFGDLTAYVDAISGIFPATVTAVDLYGTGFTGKVKTELLNALKDGRNVRVFDAQGLHDRFILKDRDQGRVMGTSFGGFGSKFFFTEELSAADVAEVRAELRRLAPFPTQLNRGGGS